MLYLLLNYATASSNLRNIKWIPKLFFKHCNSTGRCTRRTRKFERKRQKIKVLANELFQITQAFCDENVTGQ